MMSVTCRFMELYLFWKTGYLNIDLPNIEAKHYSNLKSIPRCQTWSWKASSLGQMTRWKEEAEGKVIEKYLICPYSWSFRHSFHILRYSDHPKVCLIPTSLPYPSCHTQGCFHNLVCNSGCCTLLALSSRVQLLCFGRWAENKKILH